MSVLVIAPHMDDEVLGCGGLIQRFEEVTVAFVTEAETDERLDSAFGEYVSYDGSKRVEEMETVAHLLGYQARRLDFVTHQLDGLPVVDLMCTLEGLFDGAELVLAPGPSHDQDHQAVRRAVGALMRPHRYGGSVLEYLTWGAPAFDDPAVVLPLTRSEMNVKLAALEKYATQIAPGGAYDPQYAYSPDSVTAYARVAGRLAHAPHAEAFLPRRLVPNSTTARLFGYG